MKEGSVRSQLMLLLVVIVVGAGLLGGCGGGASSDGCSSLVTEKPTGPGNHSVISSSWSQAKCSIGVGNHACYFYIGIIQQTYSYRLTGTDLPAKQAIQ